MELEMSLKQHSFVPGLSGQRRLWGGWCVAIVAWGVHLFLSYFLVDWYCRHPKHLPAPAAKLVLNSVTLLCFFFSLYGGRLAWAFAVELKSKKGSINDAHYAQGRFMAICGILLSLFLSTIILVQGLPNLVLPPCHI